MTTEQKPLFKPVQGNPNFPALEQDILTFWKQARVFERSLEQTKEGPTFTFFEGPPTANGQPGVHHVQARSFKDLFPRFRTMQGFHVPRKAGWDTHGLPVELGVEKKLGLNSKREVEAYGIDKFNAECRASVFEYEAEWRRFTERMGYWVDLDDAYMTLHRDYIESIWWSVKNLNEKGLLYKGFRVAPYCPKDGTTLSNAEVSEGYKDIQDPSVYVPFRLTDPASLGLEDGAAFLVWTTTPWTLPYNVGVAIHPEFEYVAARDRDGAVLILAASLRGEVLGEDAEVVKTFRGSELERVAYQPLFTEAYDAEGEGKPVWMSGLDTYVSDSDGTGIVHTAPAFGEDDMRLARNYGFPVIVGVDGEGKHRFGPWAGMFFRDANTEIVRDLRARGLMWREKNFLHAYPHCWRCGTPLMYYATESWYLNNTRLKERLIELNQTIDWHPPHIKNGRYGGWLENLIDWNLSRSRYWGTPLPVWEAEDGEYRVIGSYAELAELSGRPELTGPDFDPHRPFVDDITFEADGKTFRRVPYVMDVWYDSGSMPFAQHHYPFENKEKFENGGFPADFIAEAIDQTRGWFNSLHQIGTMVFDSVAYKSVICSGHILDEKGAKMSKSKGNVVNPWQVFDQYGADAARWYMYVSAPPELSRRFGMNLVGEAFRSYFLTLWNTYSFFVLYANLDQPDLTAAAPADQRPEVDRWLLAKVQTLTATVTGALENYDPTGASRALQDFVTEDLSNWYVRRNRRRFWAGDDGADHNAYATLHTALVTVTKLTAPFTPFLAETLYQNLVRSVDDSAPESVHLAAWPVVDEALLVNSKSLIEDMSDVVRIVSMGRALRAKASIKNRQPLSEVLIWNRGLNITKNLIDSYGDQISEELNVKKVSLINPESFGDHSVYRIRLNFKSAGMRYGKKVQLLAKEITRRNELAKSGDTSSVNEIVSSFVNKTVFTIMTPDGEFMLERDDILIDLQVPDGYKAEYDNGILVAFDTTLTRELELEGLARDLVRGVQDARKKAGFEVQDRIALHLDLSGDAREAAEVWQEYLSSETLAETLVFGAGGGFEADVEGGKAYLERLETVSHN
ncbi:isoleucine--tRNA ligase [Deinococcus sp. 14RED07]|uniref:isoleucine--tRNA ligase n=1 Tax=Deinococcus sp. 14RED07 TaxID=2745874 RepID=UPI001E5B7906|nr:isoleucine--tRNA ligase [Deinococcus sp. 14RED07]MCD0174843.1 isoleucine--tRNA ligase [Deinococcus sp. 14RED07]